MPAQENWTNKSVRLLAGDEDPIVAVTERARRIVVQAMDDGWRGPPFDPMALADLLRLDILPCDDVREARTVTGEDARARIEYNPNRPPGRRRYSIAHEIAHTLFPDCGERIRHRSPHTSFDGGDDWQLEALCNIAAAEFLMPIGSLPALDGKELNIETVLGLQRRFEVSTEAILIRIVTIVDHACAMFCASRVESGPDAGKYKVDYVIGSRAWRSGIPRGLDLPSTSVLSECTAIGYTAKADEEWHPLRDSFHVECVGIPPYPGSTYPRVVGLLSKTDEVASSLPISYLHGDALDPRGAGPRMIVQVVNDATPNWSGRGLAGAVRRKWPASQDAFLHWAETPGNLQLGKVHVGEVAPDLIVASMVAQKGYGPSSNPRIRYEALQRALQQVARLAKARGASVHMPRIGCGEAGGAWSVVRDLIAANLLSTGVSVTVYDLPGREYTERQVTLPLG